MENLTWKDAAGAVTVNPLTFIPGTLDSLPGVAGVPDDHAAELAGCPLGLTGTYDTDIYHGSRLTPAGQP